MTWQHNHRKNRIATTSKSQNNAHKTNILMISDVNQTTRHTFFFCNSFDSFRSSKTFCCLISSSTVNTSSFEIQTTHVHFHFTTSIIQSTTWKWKCVCVCMWKRWNLSITYIHVRRNEIVTDIIIIIRKWNRIVIFRLSSFSLFESTLIYIIIHEQPYPSIHTAFVFSLCVSVSLSPLDLCSVVNCEKRN